MLFSRPVSPPGRFRFPFPIAVLLSGLALLLVGAASGIAAAQEISPEEQPRVQLLGKGVGSLASGDFATPLGWGLTPAGPIVELDPIVARLGGHLEIGPLGQSFTLTLGDTTFVLVPGSAALTSGTEIVPLGAPPWSVDGRFLVPLELLERTFGAILGVSFAWEEANQRLVLNRPPERDLPVEITWVHLQGVTTLVLQFPEPPRYRVVRSTEGAEVLLIGDRLVLPAAPPRVDDPLIRGVELSRERVRLRLAPGCTSESYTLRAPFRLVFDVFREAAESTTTALVSPRETLRRGIHTVVLDPGHGGKESGAIGPAGSAEKELVLLLASSLSQRLEQELGVRVVLTRSDDVDLGLDERSALANQNKADLFISLHLNSSFGRHARGAETYFLSLQASDQRAADSAAVENYVGREVAPAGSEDWSLQLLLWDLAQSQHLAASQRLASLIQEELNQKLDVRDRGVKQAPFRVLMGAAMPAVLVEAGFISPREEEQLLRTPEYRAEIAATLVRAVRRFKAELEQGAASAAPPAVAGPPR